MCNGLQTDQLAYRDIVRVKGTGNDSCSYNDTYLTFDNSLFVDDETLLTFLEDDGTICNDYALLSSEAIETLKKHAVCLGISKAELLQ